MEPENATIRRKFPKVIIFILMAVIILAIGFLTGWFSRPIKAQTLPVTTLRDNTSGYKFISPLILLQVPTEDTSPQFASLKNKLTAYVKNAISAKNATDISVYYRDLNSNNWTSVNGSDKYSPASMLKVVSMIAFLRAVENDPSLLEKEVTITSSGFNDDTSQDFYPPQSPIVFGQTYTATNLLSRMIMYSDNNALLTLDTLTGTALLEKTYTDFGLNSIISSTDVDSMTAGQYSRFFRALYNGTYLSPELSEEALDLLSKTTFTQGLQAGVPSNIIVSHKFGERTITNQNPTTTQTLTTHELHDCGIIYRPSDPYLLCVMTKGNDFPTLQNAIKDISQIVWNNVSIKGQ